MVQNNHSSPENMDSTKTPDTETLATANKKDPLLEGGHSMKTGDMWNFKHGISPPECYELLIKT